MPAMLSRMQWLVKSDHDVEQETGKNQTLSATPVINIKLHKNNRN